MNKVLVADDTKNIRLLLMKCLEHEGYRVETANDGQEALDMFKKNEYDLAFLDIKMPRLSGTEVLKSIRESGINTPVIIITAYATVKNAVDCTKLGAVTYLQKPFTSEKIRSVLSDLLDERGQTELCLHTESILKNTKELIEKGDFTDAFDILKTAQLKEINNPEVYLLFSKIHHGLGDKEKSDKFYKAYQIFKN